MWELSSCKFAYGHGLQGKYPVPSEWLFDFRMAREPGIAFINMVKENLL
ncbi:MAG: hypothetical protein KGD73_08290 [Candidatus Lokiarchaeota archaeon]|nr:hypothetical protein [Candidatus Lokiarchaeota archaeon]